MNKKEDISLFLAVEAVLNNSMRTLRETQVMTVEDVAKLYEVAPSYLQRRIKINPDRFPKDFMFSITKKEQILLNTKHSFVLTEGGILILGGQLRSEKARKIHMQFIQYFVKLNNQYIERLGINNADTFLIFESLKRIKKDQ
jgi:phage regulator Rha-like protein